MLKNRGIAFKLAFFILLSSLTVFIFIFAYNYMFSKKMIQTKIKQNSQNLTYATVNKIDTVLLPLEKIPQSLSMFLESSHYTKQELLIMLKKSVANNPNIYGCTVAFAPHMFSKDKLYFAPYYYRANGKLKLKYIGNSSYRYFYWDWYQLTKELHRATWSEPYYEKGGGAIMATYSVPFYKTVNSQKTFAGVVAVDISLDWLQKIVASIKIGQTGYAFLISKDGRFITYPNSRFIMNETIFTIAKEYNMPYLRTIGRKMIDGKSGFLQINSVLTDKLCWLSFAPLSSSGWALGVMFPQKELMADVRKLNEHVIFIGLVGFFILILIVIFISNSITKPLVALTNVTKDVAKGNLHIDIPYTHRKDEVGKLAQSFEFMKKSLRDYIDNLKKTTAEKERIESELNIAAKIQESMLPRIFPPFPDRKEFNIYATMHPAKEVGGDFYDFFLIDDSKLCFLIGDVSGKGVPAALFMAIMKYLLKTEATRNLNPSEILGRVNQTICPDNETCMFATVFIGILDLKSGVLNFANAGHNPPVLCLKDGSIKFLEVSHGFVVGVMENATYKDQQIVLDKEDILFLYTDGVTEAMDIKGNLFSEERLKKSLDCHIAKNRDVVELIELVKKDIKEFVKEAPQSDDITMLTVKIEGKSTENNKTKS